MRLRFRFLLLGVVVLGQLAVPAASQDFDLLMETLPGVSPFMSSPTHADPNLEQTPKPPIVFRIPNDATSLLQQLSAGETALSLNLGSEIIAAEVHPARTVSADAKFMVGRGIDAIEVSPTIEVWKGSTNEQVPRTVKMHRFNQTMTTYVSGHGKLAIITAPFPLVEGGRQEKQVSPNFTATEMEALALVWDAPDAPSFQDWPTGAAGRPGLPAAGLGVGNERPETGPIDCLLPGAGSLIGMPCKSVLVATTDSFCDLHSADPVEAAYDHWAIRGGDVQLLGVPAWWLLLGGISACAVAMTQTDCQFAILEFGFWGIQYQDRNIAHLLVGHAMSCGGIALTIGATFTQPTSLQQGKVPGTAYSLHDASRTVADFPHWNRIVFAHEVGHLFSATHTMAWTPEGNSVSSCPAAACSIMSAGGVFGGVPSAQTADYFWPTNHVAIFNWNFGQPVGAPES